MLAGLAAYQVFLDGFRLVFLGTVIGFLLFLRWAFTWEKDHPRGPLAPKAEEISKLLGVKYVAMGHTHDTDLQRLGSEGQEYFNTGCWNKVFSERERLIREESELVFLQGLRHPEGFTMRLMKWLDGPREPRLVKLFSRDLPDKTAERPSAPPTTTTSAG
jgi:hypothetical protein